MTIPMKRRARHRAQFRIDAIVSVAILVATGVVIWRHWPPTPLPPIPIPAESITFEGMTTKGSPSATVVLIAYSDFECRFCGEFARQVLPAFDRDYVATGKVRLAYHHVTPPNHRRALPAAAAAECAGRQGKFWEMHDRLFVDQTKLDDASLTAHADALQLDRNAFTACQADPLVAEQINLATAEARRLRVTGTPGFFIGRVQADGRVRVTGSLRGAIPLAQLQEAVDGELRPGIVDRLFAAPTATTAGAVAALGVAAVVLWRRRVRLL